MTNWEKWVGHCRIARSPYVDWWSFVKKTHENQHLTLQCVLPELNDLCGMQCSAHHLQELQTPKHSSTLKPEGYNREAPDVPNGLDVFPVPLANSCPGFWGYVLDQPEDADVWLPERDYPTVEDGTVIAAVIDVDVALGHRRFRTKDGKTRVLASWQQGRSCDPRAVHLPFGAELFASEINDLLKKHSGDDLTAPLDQDGFNRDAGLVDYDTVGGSLGLARREAHGTHVMGIVGGADPTHEPEFSERVRLLVVNLPPPSAYGEGGAFLDHYLVFAMRWILEMYEQICKASKPKTPVPLITNISFGKQAGSKDENQLFVGAISRFAGDRDKGRLNCVLPAGNDNLSQTNMRVNLRPGQVKSLEWRVQPDDQTSNFVEVWVEKRKGPATDTAPAEIDVVPPGAAEDGFAEARTSEIRDLIRGTGRIYCDMVARDGEPGLRYRYLICLAPDQYQDKGRVGAAAGKWRICIRNASDEVVSVRASVQTDQSTLPGQKNARRSYFEDEGYLKHEWSGRLADSYGFVEKRHRAPYLDYGSDISKHGTLNSYAANNLVATIAGYRQSDGRPAPYSATGTGRRDDENGRGAPTVAFPTDDGYAHFGVLSDGAADGSTLAMRGTSFACAAATRKIVEAWLDGSFAALSKSGSINSFLNNSAADTGTLQEWWNAHVDIEKVGRGRVAYQPARRVQRL